MRSSISIGIDPGLSGGMAAINAASSEVLEVMDTPVVISEGKRLYDIGGMSSAIRRMSLFGDAVVILEQTQAMPGQGVAITPKGRRKPRDGRADALCLAYYGAKV